MLSPRELLDNLPHFTGTEGYYRYMGGVKLTDGVKFLADGADCYWFLDIVVSCRFEPKVKEQPFQVWKLKVNKDETAVVTCEDGNDNEVYRQELNYTDFPLPEIEIWCTNDVILLPSEY